MTAILEEQKISVKNLQEYFDNDCKYAENTNCEKQMARDAGDNVLRVCNDKVDELENIDRDKLQSKLEDATLQLRMLTSEKSPEKLTVNMAYEETQNWRDFCAFVEELKDEVIIFLYSLIIILYRGSNLYYESLHSLL